MDGGSGLWNPFKHLNLSIGGIPEADMAQVVPIGRLDPLVGSRSLT
jgi:hypothetical protein